MSELNLITLAPYFTDNEAARELLEEIRWPNGPVCPHCESNEAYKLEPKEGSKTPVRPGVYKCKECRKQFTVTVGTIFESSRIPLSKWLAAIYMMCSSKKGVSAHQLHRELDITYKSAWFMCHRIREAMDSGPLAEMLAGIVEIDETYVGGKPRPHDGKEHKRGRGTDKTPVVAMVEREGNVKAQKVDSVSGKSLKGLAQENIDPQARVITDEYKAYNGLDKMFAEHGTVTHSAGEYANGDVNTNTAESYFSLIKRGHIGTFHHMSDTHLNRYVHEFSFRWNHRKTTDGQRTKSLIRQVGGKRLMYKDVIKTEKK